MRREEKQLERLLTLRSASPSLMYKIWHKIVKYVDSTSNEGSCRTGINVGHLAVSVSMSLLPKRSSLRLHDSDLRFRSSMLLKSLSVSGDIGAQYSSCKL